MAGHSKWANIRFRKAAQDSKRGKIFTKLIRAITIAARTGGAELENNPPLRDAINKALKANMKRDTVDNAIKRGIGGGEGSEMIESRYEGHGPGGVAVIVDCVTDNKNRTVAEVRHAFTKSNGSLGKEGSVAYLFNHQGQICFAPGADEEKIMEAAIEAGAEDVIANDDGSIDIITAVDNFHQVKSALDEAKLENDSAEIMMQAASQIELDKETAEKVLKLLDRLEDLDDVQNVYSNAEFPDEFYLSTD